jgi:hypothetical protein
MKCKKLLEYAKAYDGYKYPFGLYKDLVIDGNPKGNGNRFELMGAWKTGSIRIDENGTKYTDGFGDKYEFTKRWSSHTPVGYSVWKNLDNPSLLIEIPDKLSSDMPNFIETLTNQHGFGFIWALFVAHICKPQVYPLYDQHVWRAFRNISSKGTEYPASAPNNWSNFLDYSKFFQDLRKDCDIPYWKLDQALWVFGKSIKKYTNRSQSQHHTQPNFLTTTTDTYVHSITLGYSKPFWWFIDEQCNIKIGRSFKNGAIHSKDIPVKLITELLDYLSKPETFPLKEFPLAHNVEKLNKCKEVAGIGSFLFKNGFNTTQSQLASHLAAILYGAKIWNYNGKVIGQRYWFSGNDSKSKWCKEVQDYYIDLLQSD